MAVFITGAGKTPNGLPSGYTKLDYIQSSGTQYINTGYIPKTNTKVIADIDFLSGNTTYNCIFGVGQTSSNQFVVYRTNASTITGQIYSSATYNTSGVAINGRHTVELSNGAFKYGTFSTTFAAQSFTYSYPLAIFAMNSAGSPTLQAHMALYSFKIYEGETLVHDFVPCINLSNVIGLYDVVGKQFYSNAGTGEFAGG